MLAGRNLLALMCRQRGPWARRGAPLRRTPVGRPRRLSPPSPSTVEASGSRAWRTAGPSPVLSRAQSWPWARRGERGGRARPGVAGANCRSHGLPHTDEHLKKKLKEKSKGPAAAPVPARPLCMRVPASSPAASP